MSDISFNTACKELKIAQIAQLTFAFSSNIRPLLLLGKSYANEQKCNNDVSKNSPIEETTNQTLRRLQSNFGWLEEESAVGLGPE